MSVLAQAAVCAAAFAVLIRTVTGIISMTPESDHGVRTAFIIWATGSFAEIMGVLNGHVPGLEESLFVCGAGLAVILERRCHCSSTEETRHEPRHTAP